MKMQYCRVQVISIYLSGEAVYRDRKGKKKVIHWVGAKSVVYETQNYTVICLGKGYLI